MVLRLVGGVETESETKEQHVILCSLDWTISSFQILTTLSLSPLFSVVSVEGIEAVNNTVVWVVGHSSRQLSLRMLHIIPGARHSGECPANHSSAANPRRDAQLNVRSVLSFLINVNFILTIKRAQAIAVAHTLRA